MTSILGAIHEQVPFAIGDVMISSPRKPANNVIHPMSGIPAANAPVWFETRYAVDWRQKLVLIGPHLLVAWAGSMLEASATIRRMRERYAQIDPTDFLQLETCLQVADELEISNCDFIFLLANRQQWALRSYGRGATGFKSSWSENAVAAGSGTDMLIDSLDVVSEFGDRAIDPYNRTVGQLVLAAARMWYFDLSGVGATYAFGGCFEMAIRQNSQVAKLDDVLFVSHVYRPNEGIGLLPYFLKIDYVGELLVARVLDFSLPPKSPEVDFEYKRTAVYVIPPVDTIWSASNPAPEREAIMAELGNLNASHFGTYVNIPSVDPNKNPHSVSLHTYNTESRPIEFEFGEGELPVGCNMSDTYLNGVIRAVRDTLVDASEPVPEAWSQV